jgi:hypothetical protein
MIKLGQWYKTANNYEEMNELEPFSWEELQAVEKSFKRMFETLKDNKLKIDEVSQRTIEDFLGKAKKRIMMSAQQLQGDYEHMNQVKPGTDVGLPSGGSSDKANAQMQGNNNNSSNVSV